jgi:hypothetical protein
LKKEEIYMEGVKILMKLHCQLYTFLEFNDTTFIQVIADDPENLDKN